MVIVTINLEVASIIIIFLFLLQLQFEGYDMWKFRLSTAPAMIQVKQLMVT